MNVNVIMMNKILITMMNYNHKLLLRFSTERENFSIIKKYIYDQLFSFFILSIFRILNKMKYRDGYRLGCIKIHYAYRNRKGYYKFIEINCQLY